MLVSTRLPYAAQSRFMTDFGMGYTSSDNNSADSEEWNPLATKKPTVPWYVPEHVRDKVYELYTSDPETWTIPKLAQKYRISQPRVSFFSWISTPMTQLTCISTYLLCMECYKVLLRVEGSDPALYFTRDLFYFT